MHGGGPAVVAGQALDPAYTQEHLALLEQGVSNLTKHVQNTRKFGVPVVVAVNAFASDTEAELALVKDAAKRAGDSWLCAICRLTPMSLCRPCPVAHSLLDWSALIYLRSAGAAVEVLTAICNIGTITVGINAKVSGASSSVPARRPHFLVTLAQGRWMRWFAGTMLSAVRVPLSWPRQSPRPASRSRILSSCMIWTSHSRQEGFILHLHHTYVGSVLCCPAWSCV